jgi:single-strand DNA-binding protein
MRSLNRVTLMGYLAADPDVRQTSNGINVANFSLATNREWKDNDGKKKHATDFHRVVAWRRLGEICGEYLKKGSSIYLEGELKNRSYENKEGEKKYYTEIVAKDVNILTWKKNKEGEPNATVEPIVPDENEVEEED